MKFLHKKFDVQVKREVIPTLTSWPNPEEVEDGRCPGGNRDYADLRGLSWEEAQSVIELEAEYIQRIEQASEPCETELFEEEEIAEIVTVQCQSVVVPAFAGTTGFLNLGNPLNSELLPEIMGLDIGVASTVAALSADGFIPCTSCNAGAFGGRHHETYPIVAFYVQPQSVPLLLQCAEDSEVGLDNDQGWSPEDLPIVVYADDIRKLGAFAEALSKRFGILQSTSGEV